MPQTAVTAQAGSVAAAAAPQVSAAPPPRRRFSWPMRVFLFCLLFDIVFRSFSVMFPWKDWLDELDMRRAPVRLPTRDEYIKLRHEAEFKLTDKSLDALRQASVPESVLSRLCELRGLDAMPQDKFLDRVSGVLGRSEMDRYRDVVLASARSEGGERLRKDLSKSFTSIGEYFNPWPNKELRDTKLTTWNARGKYVLAWLASRLDIVENICGINEEWPMFSPNASPGVYLARARLQYADGTECLIRQHAEPADLTRFSHWNQEKILDHETKVRWSDTREDECWGWCNLLSYRHAVNEHGSPLKRILLYRVFIDYPPPGDPDPRGFLLRQMELTRDHDSPNASRTFYTFNLPEDRKHRQGTMEPVPKD
jgi:hypothetical protein